MIVRMFGGTLGICAGLFRRGGFGCLGAVLFVILTAAAMLGLVAMAWWGR
jgi:hypothetical protein